VPHTSWYIILGSIKMNLSGTFPVFECIFRCGFRPLLWLLLGRWSLILIVG
jgi:hypothetical protein